jgi:hypothetical protein
METLYYLREYFINKKLIGSIKMDKPDREQSGYLGKQTFILQEDTIVDVWRGAKTIKKGTEVSTEQHPICGRIKR